MVSGTVGETQEVVVGRGKEVDSRKKAGLGQDYNAIMGKLVNWKK